MTGWLISVYRQARNRAEPAEPDSHKGTRIAVWQSAYSGLDWIEKLVKEGKVISLSGNGYPFWFTAKPQHLIPTILSGPPDAREHWASDAHDVLLAGWVGKTEIDRAIAQACDPDEWLLVEVFDES